MAKEIYKNIYLHEIPLPKNPLRAINCYIITSEDRNLIIDTGFNIEPCKESMMKALDELNLKADQTDVLITHLHSDHCGLASFLSEAGMDIYAGKVDGIFMNEMTTEAYWDTFKKYAQMYDLDRDHVDGNDHPGYKFCPKELMDFKLLEEGNIINLGDYRFEVVDVPGHTPGHIALYERKHKLMFCGDHILDQITPNIAFWGYGQDMLQVYFDSLNKVAGYEIEYLFPAHRNIIKDYKKRIQELLKHHDNRLEEILNIISDKEISVRDVAAQMKWELKYSNWTEFPNAQKWFASSEAMAHLEHLACTDKVDKQIKDGIFYFKARA